MFKSELAVEQEVNEKFKRRRKSNKSKQGRDAFVFKPVYPECIFVLGGFFKIVLPRQPEQC